MTMESFGEKRFTALRELGVLAGYVRDKYKIMSSFFFLCISIQDEPGRLLPQLS